MSRYRDQDNKKGGHMGHLGHVSWNLNFLPSQECPAHGTTWSQHGDAFESLKESLEHTFESLRHSGGHVELRNGHPVFACMWSWRHALCKIQRVAPICQLPSPSNQQSLPDKIGEPWRTVFWFQVCFGVA